MLLAGHRSTLTTILGMHNLTLEGMIGNFLSQCKMTHTWLMSKPISRFNRWVPNLLLELRCRKLKPSLTWSYMMIGSIIKYELSSFFRPKVNKRLRLSSIINSMRDFE